MKRILMAILCAVWLLCGAAMAEKPVPQQLLGDFTCLEYDEEVKVIDYAGAEGVETLYVPAQLNGKPVTELDLSMLPATVKTVYAHENLWLRSENMEGEVLVVRYIQAADVTADSDRFETLGQLPEGSLAYVSAEYHNKNYSYWDGDRGIVASQLPTTLGDQPCVNTMGSYYMYAERDGWVYKIHEYDNSTEVSLMDFMPAEGQTMLMIPSELDGYRVTSWNTYMVEKHGFKMVVYPEHCWTSYYGVAGQDDLKIPFTGVRYMTYAHVQEDEYWSERLSFLKEDQVAIREVFYRNEKGNEKSTQVYAHQLPAEIDGKEAVIVISGEDVLYTNADGWTYYRRSEPYEVVLVDKAPVNGETTLFIPTEVDGYPVDNWNTYMVEKYGYHMVVFPRNVSTTYISDNGQEKLTTPYTSVQYMTQAQVLEYENLAKQLPEMTADQVVIYSVNYRNEKGESKNTQLHVNDLPSEILGSDVVIGLWDKTILYTDATGWTYYLYNSTPMKAVLVDKAPVNGETTLEVPMTVAGYPVYQWNTYLVEKDGYERVIHPGQVGNTYIHPQDAKVQNLEYIELQYVDYAYAQQNGYVDRVPQMAEGDVAVINVSRVTYVEGSRNYDTIRYAVADLPATIDGKTCHNALHSNYATYTDAGFVYAYSDDRTSCTVVDTVDAPQGDTLLIPETLGGVKVKGVSTDELTVAGVKTFLVPYSCWTYAWMNADQTFDTFYYWNESIIANSSNPENNAKNYMPRADKELVLSDADRTVGGKSGNKMEYYEIPTQFGEYTLRNEISIRSDVNQYTSGDFTYALYTPDTVIVTGYTNEFSKSVIVPARLEGKTVVGIANGSNASYAIYNNEITSLELPSSLTFLGQYAIYAYKLPKLEIPAGVTEIHTRALGYNTKINKLVLPEGLTYLGAEWSNFGKLQTVNFPSSLTSLSPYSFYRSGFKNLKLPNTIESIGKAAFSEMSYLASLTLPTTLTEIPELMVAGSKKLQKITIPETVESIGAQAFAGCEKLGTVTFGKKDVQLKTIGDGAFASTALGKIVLPEGVTSIGKDAFNSCSKLNNVTLPSTLTEMGAYAFASCTALQKIVLPDGLTAIPDSAFVGCKKLNSVTIPASVTYIDDYAFEGCAAKLTLTVEDDSYAKEWADAHGIPTKKLTKKK